MMQIVRFDAALDQGTHQGRKRRRIVIHPADEHALAQHGNAGIDDARAGRARTRGKLARMVGVQHHIGRLAG